MILALGREEPRRYAKRDDDDEADEDGVPSQGRRISCSIRNQLRGARRKSTLEPLRSVPSVDFRI